MCTTMNGLGAAVDAAVASQAVAKPSVWDQINKGLQVVQTGANIYTQIKPQSGPSGSSTTSQYIPQTNQATPVIADPPVDNTKKYLLIAGGVAVAGTGLYFLTRKKKGKK